jgi:fructokinase
MFVVCGDSLFDFFLDRDDGPEAATYRARAGGSPFNVAVGLARLGVSTGLLTALSDDLLGGRLRRVLENEAVSTRYCVATRRPTTISLVGLDAAGVPAYQFYSQGSADTGLAEGDLPTLGPEVTGLHFGSYSIAETPVADALAALAARERGRFITLDPNVRPTVVPDMAVWRTRLGALLPHAAVVKISSEDLDLLHPGMSGEALAADLIGCGVRLVVVTGGEGSVRGWTAGGTEAEARPPAVPVVDTVGAGDTFMAALIYRLIREHEGPDATVRGLDRAALADMLDFAARAAAITCSRRGADLPRLAELT